MATLDLLRLEAVWRTLSVEDKATMFERFPDVFGAIELWVNARQ